MNYDLKGKSAVIAGASSGIGKAVALALSKEGCSVSICSRDESRISKAKDEIKTETGNPVICSVADVTKKEDIKRFIENTLNNFKKIDILVTNAGGPPMKSLMEISSEQWIEGINLSLMSTILLIKEVTPHMILQKSGSIINVTSVSVKQPIDNLGISNTARAGVVGFSKTFANELGANNIRINTICPGYTLTERLTELFEARAIKNNRSVEEEIKITQQEVPLKRLAKPEEIANLAVFLASNKASYITGTTIQADGGYIRGIL